MRARERGWRRGRKAWTGLAEGAQAVDGPGGGGVGG